MISKATIARIMDATLIEEVIGDFVTLKRRGSNYSGLCPFHADNNPSMNVSSTRQIFKCFACGKAGNVITFLMEHEHISYPEALRYLANRYNIEIEEKEETPEEAAQRMHTESLTIVTEFAQKYYSEMLYNDEMSSRIGLNYFYSRGFTDEIIKKFGLGYAPSSLDRIPNGMDAGGNPQYRYKKARPSFSDVALEKGYNADYLVETGLSFKKDDGRLVDMYYDRVVFPIYTISGKVTAFSCRVLGSSDQAKYKNSPDSEIYHKSYALYGFYQAKNAIAARRSCILVEGNADVVMMHQKGIENVVASCGTALTSGQVLMIKRFADTITVIYDSDAAGIKAALKAINLILQENMKVNLVLLPEGEDPDSFAKAHEKDEIEDYIDAHSQDFVSYMEMILMKDVGQNDIYGRHQVVNEIMRSISYVSDENLRGMFVQKLARLFDMDENKITRQVGRIWRERRDQQRAQKEREAERREQPAAVPPPPSAEDAPDEYPSGESMTPDPDYAPVQAEPAAPEKSSAVQAFSYLSQFEKEILSLLVRFGEAPLPDESSMMYGAGLGRSVTVAQYIKDSMDNDELVFTCPLYKQIYDEYFSIEKPYSEDWEEVQGSITKYFTFHSDQEIVRFMTDILDEDQLLTSRKLRESLTPEVHTLGKSVPKAVLTYKLRLLEHTCTEIIAGIKAAEKAGDEAAKSEALNQLVIINSVKLALTKEINSL
ncbi:MAG: DNA primase [Bacteroidales bacterium]|nr:DNA primase [Candidatus Equibacterium intestinale]